MKLEPNLSLTDAAIRYVVMMVLPIIGGLYESVVLMLLCMPIFLTAITGFCPIYYMLGISHVGKETPFAIDETTPAVEMAEEKPEIAVAA